MLGAEAGFGRQNQNVWRFQGRFSLRFSLRVHVGAPQEMLRVEAGNFGVGIRMFRDLFQVRFESLECIRVPTGNPLRGGCRAVRFQHENPDVLSLRLIAGC